MNEVLGYTCVCSRGYEHASQADPKCVNINECQDDNTNPCHNGGKCHDLTPPPMMQPKPGEELRFREPSARSRHHRRPGQNGATGAPVPCPAAWGFEPGPESALDRANVRANPNRREFVGDGCSPARRPKIRQATPGKLASPASLRKSYYER
uniref:EGF-like domain-containing protein n=1 Tax=Mesocestoides corti TaxID=53468 RepID=A0A5K3F0V4_MESCO